MIEGILKAVQLFWRRGDSLRLDPQNKFRVFTIAWILLPLVFFSLSSSKLPGYILPILPAVALIAGERLSRLHSHPGNSKWVIRITACLCLLFAAVVVAYAGRSGDFSARCVSLTAAPLAVAGAFGLLWTKRGSVFAMMTAGATLGTVVFILNCGVTKLVEHESAKHLLELAAARGYSQAVVYGLQRDDRSPEFYAAGRVAYDADGEAIMYEGVGQVVWESRRRQATVLALVPLGQVGQFTQLTSVPVDVIGNNGRVALVAVGP